MSFTYPLPFGILAGDTLKDWLRAVDCWRLAQGDGLTDPMVGPRVLSVLHGQASAAMQHLDPKDVMDTDGLDITATALRGPPTIQVPEEIPRAPPDRPREP